MTTGSILAFTKDERQASAMSAMADIEPTIMAIRLEPAKHSTAGASRIPKSV